MSFADSELISSNNPKTCDICDKHMNNVISWENNVCPSCYMLKEKKLSIDSKYNFNPLYTVAKTILVYPIITHLNLYTHSEMMRMKK